MNTFWLHGYEHTSLPNLMAASGLLRGSLYAAFGQKDAMFNVALKRYIDQIREAIFSNAPGIDGIRDMLDAVVEITHDDPERRGCMIVNAIPESQSLSTANRKTMDRGLAELRLFIGTKLQQAKDASTLKPDLEPLIALVFAATVSIRLLGRAGRSRRLLQDTADGAVIAVKLVFLPTTAREPSP